MPPDTADTPFGERTTAGKLFGASGGVMEAAIRTAHYLVTGKELEKLDVQAVRGLDGVKEARVTIDGLELGVAVVSGLGNACRLLDQIRAGRKRPAFHRSDDLSRRVHRRRRPAASAPTRGRAARMQALYADRRAGAGARPRTTTRRCSGCTTSFSASRWERRATICCTRITPARCAT